MLAVRIDNRVKWVWPGEYVYFIVHKENCDTMDAAVRIAERLRLKYVTFTFLKGKERACSDICVIFTAVGSEKYHVVSPVSMCSSVY